MWQKAAMWVDTSALCSLYDLTDHYRLTMVSILSSLKDRIWIPYQVKEEYLRNRKKAITNPIVEKYRLPEVTNSHFVKAVRECIKQWETNKYYHPYIDSDQLKGLKNEVEEACAGDIVAVATHYSRCRPEGEAVADGWCIAVSETYPYRSTCLELQIALTAELGIAGSTRNLEVEDSAVADGGNA